MSVMLQENTVYKHLLSYQRTQTKGHGLRKKNPKTSSHQPQNSLSAESDCQQRLRRSRPDKKLIAADTPARQHNTKIKSQVLSRNGLKETRHKYSNGAEESVCQSFQQICLKEQTDEPSDHRTKAKHNALLKQEEEDSDSASDLSDSERRSTLHPQIAPPDLRLRAEVVDPSDLHPSGFACRGRTHSRGSYPDFLPPPFNSWSLKQLAAYLNTDGRGIPRPKPVGQLERYLDRLLQMEWQQIQTVQEESSRSHGSIPRGRQTCSHSSLSSPKCILQCQRAFPLALLSSLTNAPILQLPTCPCPHCKKRYPISQAYQHHTRLSPLLEKRGQAAGFPKRSCSESRAHPSDRRQKTREHRLSDPLSDGSHLKRMQAIGNIRNPIGSTNNPEEISASTASNVGLNSEKIKRSGRRSHSCGGMKETGYKSRGRSEQRKSHDQTEPVPDLSGVKSSDGPKAGPFNRKQKRVEFLTK